MSQREHALFEVRALRKAYEDADGTTQEKRLRQQEIWQNLRTMAAGSPEEPSNASETTSSTKIELAPDEKDVLFRLSQAGNADALKKFIKSKPDVNFDCQDADGYGSLHFAALYGHLEAAKVLLKYGHCNVDLQTTSGTTPLILACMHHHKETAAYLFKHKANPFHVNASGQTPISLNLETIVKDFRSKSKHKKDRKKEQKRKREQESVENQIRKELEDRDREYQSIYGKHAASAGLTFESVAKKKRMDDNLNAGQRQELLAIQRKSEEQIMNHLITRFQKVEAEWSRFSQLLADMETAQTRRDVQVSDLPLDSLQHLLVSLSEPEFLFAVGKKDVQSRLKELQRRWHPDRFVRLLRDSVGSDNSVIDKVTQISQKLNMLVKK